MKADLTAPGNILSDFLSLVAAAADIPVSRFFGTAPKGLNATGEGDRKNYHTAVRGKQMRVFDPLLRRLDPMLIRSAYGREVEYSYTWKPLEEQTPLEEAQEDNLVADKHNKYLSMGVVTPSMVARELQSTEEYAGIDEEYIQALEDIEMNEDEPEEMEPEEAETDADQSEEAQADPEQTEAD
jgi:phage-related protein (TIGR01555 family)